MDSNKKYTSQLIGYIEDYYETCAHTICIVSFRIDQCIAYNVTYYIYMYD